MKKALIYGLSLALVFALSACADNQGATISQEQKEPIKNEETVADPLSDTEKAPATDEQEPYIVSLDDLPLDLLGAFEYGYSTVHSEKPDLERLEMELDLIRQWCDSFVIAIPDNLNEVYSEWHAQYEATLNAIDEGGNTQSGSTTGTNSGTQSGTVDDITPPSNNNGNTNSSGGNTGNTSKPSGGSSSGNTQSNPSTGSSSSGSNSNGFTPPSDEELEAAFGEAPLEGSGNVDGSGTYVPDLEDRLDGTQGTISW